MSFDRALLLPFLDDRGSKRHVEIVVQAEEVLDFSRGQQHAETDIVVGATAAFAWELPHKVDTKVTRLLHRRSRSVVFPKIEAFLQSTGLDGRACVMKALCEAAQRDPADVGKGTLVQELLHVIFTLPRDGGRFERSQDQAYEDAYQSSENCGQLYPTCQHSIYDLDF
ncbi:uncharacterized protein LOC100881341 isoform X1 [Megachile rotundata]|uniref:uncharacterized protein LOC100881341 isoform X1 n=1 Tax=Megachile rotundata TaxID=143995 RepID=UPI003FD68249